MWLAAFGVVWIALMVTVVCVARRDPLAVRGRRGSPEGSPESWFRHELGREVDRDAELAELLHTRDGAGRLELELDYRLGLKQRPEAGRAPRQEGGRGLWQVLPQRTVADTVDATDTVVRIAAAARSAGVAVASGRMDPSA